MKHLPNILSASRIPLAGAIVVVSYYHLWGTAFWMYAVASFSDVIDGPLARRLNAVSKFGGRVDKMSDLILLVGSVLAFIVGVAIPPYIAGSLVFGMVAGPVIGSLLTPKSIISDDPTTSGELSAAGNGPTHSQFVAGLVVVVSVGTCINLGFVSLAYGWHYWYIAAAIIIVGIIGVTKRGRLK